MMKPQTFGVLDTYLGFGIVGGSLLSAEVQGRRCAEIALRIIGGEPPVDIVPERTLNAPMFDARQLKRWGINEAKLPSGSIVRYREFSFWRQYRLQAIGLIAFGLIQTSIIIILWFQIKKRRRAQTDLAERLRFEEMLSGLSARFVNLSATRVDQEILAQAEEKYRTVADFTYDWEYWVNVDDKMEYVSPSCERISGYTTQDFNENPFLFKEIIVPEDRDIWERHYRDCRQELKPREIQFRIQRREGQIRWIEHSCQPVTDDLGGLRGFRASNRDVTSRKQAEIDRPARSLPGNRAVEKPARGRNGLFAGGDQAGAQF